MYIWKTLFSRQASVLNNRFGFCVFYFLSFLPVFFLGTFWIAVPSSFQKKKKIRAFYFFPSLGFAHFVCTLAENSFEEHSFGASSPSLPPARPIWGCSLFQPAQLSSPQQEFSPSNSTFFFSSWLWLGKSAYKAFCILWMYHTVILLSENSVMSIIDALEKW